MTDAMVEVTNLDAEPGTLHIRCGSDIEPTLRTAGFVGEFLEYADPLCQGPVPAAGNFLALRADFIAAAYGLSRRDVEDRLAAEVAGLRAAPRTPRIVLWFEHDLYDQLILARLLDQPPAAETAIATEYPHLGGIYNVERGYIARALRIIRL